MSARADPEAATDLPLDPLPLAQALIRCASVTPADDGAMDVLAGALAQLGFGVTRLTFGQTPNLFARLGSGAPHVCFAGHTDVVPPGAGAWRAPPFAGEVRDGVLYGRGACDMKGAIAAFVAAVAAHLRDAAVAAHLRDAAVAAHLHDAAVGAHLHNAAVGAHLHDAAVGARPERGPPRGSISLLITGDEEGTATDGTVRVLEWLAEARQIPDFCLVGEPTNPARLGEVIKIGRRGSLNAAITVQGRQGHAAYPHLADNPVHRLVRALAALTAAPLDAGSDWFQPSSLQITSIDVGNPATNVIPAAARARLNIRFNDRHSGAALSAWLRAVLAEHAPACELDVAISGEAFLTAPGPLVDRLRATIAAASGVEPRLDTGGGTSDARFIARYCPVAEFGLVGATMHQTDECVPVAELRALARIYAAVLAAFLA